jgi:hypothetical protein
MPTLTPVQRLHGSNRKMLTLETMLKKGMLKPHIRYDNSCGYDRFAKDGLQQFIFMDKIEHSHRIETSSVFK